MDLPKEQADIVAEIAKIQTKQAGNNRTRAILHADDKELTDELARLKEKLAGAKKPRLRDGDWGLGFRGKHLWVVLDASDHKNVKVGVEDENGKHIETWNNGVSGATLYGNLRDDLKVTQEDVAEFEVTGVNDGSVKVNFDCMNKESFRITITDGYGVSKAARIRFSDLKLRRMEMTQKRNAKE